MTGAERVERELRDFARHQVRAGLLAPEDQYAEVVAAVSAELPATDASVLARAWLAAARKELAAESRSWPEVTDHDRLQAAFAECEAHDVSVLAGVPDAGAVAARLASAGRRPRGVLWFSQPDVWHAIDTGTLATSLWHGDATEATPGDQLLDPVLSCFERHGLTAGLDRGRVAVAVRWQRRPDTTILR